MSLEEQIDGFLNEKNITPYQHIYNADGNTGWDIEVLMEEFAELYAQQRVNEVLDKAAEEAQMKVHDGHFKTDSYSKHVQVGANNIQIDKESILKLKSNEK